ncbi:MAG: CoA transferase [Dehalococcoidia bacterium]|nr:CoA transferase [Dehalococcoidia bacterium]
MIPARVAKATAKGTAPLHGVRVVDLSTGIAGPFCAKLLATLGASVLKVEPPRDGDPSRQVGPFPGDVPHPEKSGLFLHLNTSKRGVTLDVGSAMGRRLLPALLEGCDILVESFPPGAMAGWGLGAADFQARFPRLVTVSVSGFGQDGPYRDWKTSEIITYAMGGAMFSTGLPEREPHKLAGSVAMHQAGYLAALAAVTSYYGYGSRGGYGARGGGVGARVEGDHVDVSLFEALASSQDRRTTQLIAHQYTGIINGRRPAGTLLGAGVRPCKDGFVNISVTDQAFERFVRMMGWERALEDPRYATVESRAVPGRSDEFDIEYLLPWLLERTMEEICTFAQERRFPFTPVYNPESLLEEAFFQERGLWQGVGHPVAGRLEHAGGNMRFGEARLPQLGAAPMLGEHNAPVYCGELGLSPLEVAMLRQRDVI